MSTRARHEAKWTHSDATVRGRRQRNRGWVLLLLFGGVIMIATVAYMELMRFETVTYELRQCDEPLTEDSSWADVQAAGCDPVTVTEAASLLQIESSARSEPDRVEDSTWVFDAVAVNSPAHSLELRSPFAAETGVIAEPTNEVIRNELNGDASGTLWTGYVGSNGPTEYWLLLSP